MADVLLFIGALLPIILVNMLLIVAGVICALVDLFIANNIKSKVNDFLVVLVGTLLIIFLMNNGIVISFS